MEKILVPIDGSENSLKALKYAEDMAEKFGSQIILVNIQKPVFYEGLDPEPLSKDKETETLQEKANAVINEGLQELEDSTLSIKVEFDPDIIVGDPAEQILFLIEKEDVDLVVMGSHGLSRLRRYIIGSVSSKVLKHSKRPVLIIK
ncbi:MAG: universal stress protein [Candidatus Syntrophonatronum acetioxidans]|uniref:Universal stress protein n=1 Tax=Candidatus Syntrophonatronum acetioxidans TaxID=1795816 RepID=A0A424YGS1_9FIRM|nr:MAG: universal stress protein [Candidatus Syntrophonatronum acetioxidans]